MKKLLFLHFGGDVLRGSEHCLIESIRGVVNAGINVILLCNNPTILQSEIPSCVRIEHLKFPEIMIDGKERSLQFLKFFTTLLKLWGLLRSDNIRLIYASSGLPCQIGWPLSRLLRVPLIAHFHHPAPKRYFYIWLVRFANSIIVPSQYTASLISKKCGRESTVIYNGVDCFGKFTRRNRDPRVRAELGFTNEHVVIGQVGAFERNKRPDFLLEAFSHIAVDFPNLRLVLVGDGEMRGWLEEKSKILKVTELVKILGRVPDILPFYQQVFDINVLASESEGLGISVVEASACGVPSVVSDTTGLKEVVVNNVTGAYFKANDQRDLERVLLNLARSSDLRFQLGEKAIELAQSKFSLQTYREKIVDKIREMHV